MEQTCLRKWSNEVLSKNVRVTERRKAHLCPLKLTHLRPWLTYAHRRGLTYAHIGGRAWGLPFRFWGKGQGGLGFRGGAWDKGTWGLGVGLGDYPLGFGGWDKGSVDWLVDSFSGCVVGYFGYCH